MRMILIKNESDFFILGSFEFWSYCICSENLQNSRRQRSNTKLTTKCRI